MYIVEFERTQKDSKDLIIVRLLDMDSDRKFNRIIAETTYQGQPPQLYLEDGCNYAAVSLQRTTSEPRA